MNEIVLQLSGYSLSQLTLIVIEYCQSWLTSFLVNLNAYIVLSTSETMRSLMYCNMVSLLD